MLKSTLDKCLLKLDVWLTDCGFRMLRRVLVEDALITFGGATLSFRPRYKIHLH